MLFIIIVVRSSFRNVASSYYTPTDTMPSCGKVGMRLKVKSYELKRVDLIAG